MSFLTSLLSVPSQLSVGVLEPQMRTTVSVFLHGFQKLNWGYEVCITGMHCRCFYPLSHFDSPCQAVRKPIPPPHTLSMIIKCRTQRALTFLNVPLKVLGIVLPHQRCLGLRESAVRHPIGIDQPAVEPCVFSTAEMGKNG